MIKRLRFEHTIGGKMIAEPRVVEPIMGENEHGQLVKIGNAYPKGHRMIVDKSDFQVIQLYRKDMDLAISALSWVLGEHLDFSLVRVKRDVNTGMTEVIRHDTKLVEVQVPGIFTPKPSPDDISTWVSDYQLLYDRYPVYRDIFRQRIDPVTEATLEFLFDSQRKVFEVLMKTSDRKTKKQLEEVSAELPAWIKKVIET